jgi:hypothetical protein
MSMPGNKGVGGYGVKDLIYYGGVFAGIIIVYLTLEMFEVMPLVRLVAGLVVGVALGWSLETLFTLWQRSQRPPTESRPPDERLD